ncbi:MAG: tRNA (adenosine(37)-N6)-threonylcarbamoyltransferase complex transferase subunit TsaD [Eubacteriaceae bacterium]|nr:tRNA (adenosine(37)-N6)-threonylcarbamoyltransferase complex transferase subunit TsaD [Eubacteriaceae bacterium]
MDNITILAIETSCDETSAAVIRNGELLSNIVSSQIDIHTLYGGVVPEIASRNHLLSISRVTDKAMETSGVTFNDLNAVGVTYGPGLVGALLVGVSFAKALAYSLGVKLIGVNHMRGHISAAFLAGAKPPFICLVVSGGHTMIVKVKDYNTFELLGQTKDDAAGEAFDKVARVVGLGYPGGPKLDKLAEEGDDEYLSLPRAMLKEDNYDFSFSGIKSAVLNHINSAKMKGDTLDRAGVCASFRKCVCDILVQKTLRAAASHDLKNIAVCGGVACNMLLRRYLKEQCDLLGYKLTIPDNFLCSDNAGMIACSAHYQYLKGDCSGLDLNAAPSLSLN